MCKTVGRRTGGRGRGRGREDGNGWRGGGRKARAREVGKI